MALDFFFIVEIAQPCSERVLMTLAAQYRDYVVPLMKMTFQEITCESLSIPTEWRVNTA